MLKIREMSDIHNEFGEFTIRYTDQSKEQTLILAGDIDSAEHVQRNFEWINAQGDYFKHVIYIPGNHEFYHGCYDDVLDFYKNANWKSNVYYMDHTEKTIDGVYVWAGTLWTGMKNGDPVFMDSLRYMMNDFRIIKKRQVVEPYSSPVRTWLPSDARQVFVENKPKLFAGVKAAKERGEKTVVVTHHAPCAESIARHFRGQQMNDAYTSYLDEEVMDNGPDIWFHGHTHVSLDYKVGNTRVLCNPRGYYRHEENREFNPGRVIEIG